jgi:hypothetical protein
MQSLARFAGRRNSRADGSGEAEHGAKKKKLPLAWMRCAGEARYAITNVPISN